MIATIEEMQTALAAGGGELVFTRDGKMAVRGKVSDDVLAWLKQNRDEVRRKLSPYSLLTYRLRSGTQIHRLLKLPSDPPPPNATHWKWTHEPDDCFEPVTHS